MRIASDKNQPTDPELWEKSKATAKKRYEIWPSAYAIGHALKLYKDEGGGWKKAKTAGDTATIDPAYVKGLRKWVKATFVPKARYATLDDLIAHLKNLRDKQLNLLWEHLFYTKGLLPRDGGYESIIEDLRVKVRDELKDARAILDDDLERLDHCGDEFHEVRSFRSGEKCKHCLFGRSQSGCGVDAGGTPPGRRLLARPGDCPYRESDPSTEPTPVRMNGEPFSSWLPPRWEAQSL